MNANENAGVNDDNLRTDQKDPDGSTRIVKIPGPKGSELHCSTPGGAAWVRKYQHPPAPTPVMYAGIPDMNNTPSIRTEYRAVQNTETYHTDGGGITTNFNKVLYLQLPCAEVPAVAFKYDTTGVREQFPEDVILNPNIDTREQLRNVGSGRLTYKSGTYSLNATDFSNQGTVTVAQFRPNTAVYSNALFLEHVKQRAPRQISSIKKLMGLDVDGFELAGSPSVGDAVVVITVGKIPITSTDVAMLSPNSTVSPAKEGAFVVQRMSQPTTPYVDYAEGQTSEAPFVSKGRLFFLQATLPDNTLQFTPFISTQFNPGGGPLEVLATFDMTCAWILFEGLSVQPATGPVTVVPPYITSKHITGYEAQAYPSSILQPFMQNSAILDTKALEFGSMVVHSHVDSLPAKMNFWGALGSALLTAAPTVIKTLSDVFSKPKAKAQEPTNPNPRSRVEREVKGDEKRIDRIESQLGQLANAVGVLVRRGDGNRPSPLAIESPMAQAKKKTKKKSK